MSFEKLKLKKFCYPLLRISRSTNNCSSCFLDSHIFTMLFNLNWSSSSCLHKVNVFASLQFFLFIHFSCSFGGHQIFNWLLTIESSNFGWFHVATSVPLLTLGYLYLFFLLCLFLFLMKKPWILKDEMIWIFNLSGFWWRVASLICSQICYFHKNLVRSLPDLWINKKFYSKKLILLISALSLIKKWKLIFKTLVFYRLGFKAFVA